MNKQLSMKKYRNNGAVGALLDEYEKAILELCDILNGISKQELTTIVDTETKDPDCRSIQSILTHTVGAGYRYVIEVRLYLGEQVDLIENQTLSTASEFQHALRQMFQYNEQLFIDHPKLKLEESETQKKILTRWGQRYDVEQLFEHAIVHILRHRRQVERFLIQLRQ